MAEMAPTTRKYGKKRGLLRSLGSRRRQKHLTESAPAEKHEPLVDSMPDINEVPSKTTPERSGRDVNTIEEMASCLLDDSRSSLFGVHQPLPQDESAECPALSGEGSPKTPNGMVNFLESPTVLSPLMETSKSSPSARLGASRVEKHCPKSSGNAMRRHSTARSRLDHGQKRKESGLLRPLPQSKTLLFDPLKSHPTAYIDASSSVPLGAVEMKAGNRDLQTLKTPVRTELADAYEINQKVSAMLAATQALKAAPQETPNLPASKFTRIVPSKVLAKVSSAWDRIHSKPLQDNKRVDGAEAMEEGSFPKLPKLDYQTQGLSSAPDTMSPISTIEIRLNEGDNLNKKKVQKIVGGQVIRKPVADDGKSLRSGRQVEDPFAEAGGSRGTTPFENRLLQAELESATLPPLPQNPFDSEKGFDNDIEDRILCTTPVGSSTPRIRVERDSITNLDWSPTKQSQRTKAEVDSMLDKVATKLEDDQQMRRRRYHPISPCLAAGAHGPKRVKKHPSPSKEALEDLEMAFRKYTHLQASVRQQDELDELASSSFLSSPRSLTARDKNRLMSGRLSMSNLDELPSARSQQSDSRHLLEATTVQLSRIPRPVEVPLKRRADIRRGTAYRPAAAEADDMDELQWTSQSIQV